ncbi:MAG TPA: hypothetical protein VNZ49_06595 [Bacteroidia bacterium]|nr:hypothetical protein [Bacteroidia bacterium]
MIRKIGFIALIAAALICGTWGYFYLENLKKPTLKPFDVLSDSCTVLAEIKEPGIFTEQLTQGNLMWEEFLKISDVNRFKEVLTLLDSLTDDEETKEYLGKEPFYIALYGNEKKGDAVYAFNLSDINESEKALAFFEKNFSAKKISGGFYQCVLNNGTKTDFYIFAEAGLVVASCNKRVIESISGKNNRQTLSQNKSFTETYKTSAKDKGLGVFIHLPKFYKQAWNDFFSTISAESFFSDNSEKWIMADVGIQPSDINIQGFLPVDSVKITRVVQNQDADNFGSMYEHLPYNTFSFESINISNYGTFCHDNYNGNNGSRKNDLKKYSDSLSADAQTEINSFFGNYAARLKASTGDTTYEYGIIQISDESKVVSFFKSTAGSILVNTDSANLFLFTDKTIFSLLCAGFFNERFTYVSVFNESAVFCNSVKGMSEYRKSVTEKLNLSGNERTINFLEHNFNSDLNYLCYSDIFKNRENIKSNLSATLNKKLEESPDLFEKFDAIAFSLQKIKGSIFYKAHAGFNPKNKMYQNTLWETLADTDLYRLPVPVINHKTGETELVCQDKNNNLYLLSNTGKILWKKNIKEKILGEPVQTDYFANGKLQILFASENYIHLIDRNGNYVQDFPIKIKAGAAGGITVFDYDNSKNYRLWIPLKNKTVTCLNMDCKTVEGFVPVNIKVPLARPVEHLLLQQKDYFILSDTSGNVYVTNRKGEERFKVINKLASGNYPVYLDAGKDLSKTYLCFVDIKTKTLRKLSLADKMEISLLKADMDAENYFFDTLQEGGAPYIVLNNTEEMHLFDFFSKKISEIKTRQEYDSKAEALWFGDKKVYATLGKTSGTLILIDARTLIPIDNEIKLSALPASYDLIKGQSNYLVGFYHNKIFCIKP